MNRRGFFGALVGGIAAATGLTSLTKLPRFGGGRRVVFLKSAAVGKTEHLVSRLLIADVVDPYPLPKFSTARVACLGRSFPAEVTSAPPAAPDEPPPVWPDHSGFIDATAVLPSVAQMKRLLDRFGTSGEASPAFVEALIGELVLTRVRLAAADPRTLCALAPVAA